MATKETSPRLGTHGDIQLLKRGCNNGDPVIGSEKLEKLPHLSLHGLVEYISGKNHQSDIQINTRKFGQVLQDGLDNTKEMAEKWNWLSDNNQLNWRDTPVELRMSYDSNKNQFRVQVWNELFQIWIRLSLSKEEIQKILEG